MNALSRLKLWQKLAVLVVAMAAPTVLLGFFYLSGANSQVAMGSRLFTLLTGDTSHREEVTASEAEMDKLLSNVDASDARVGAQLKVSAAWAGIKSDWERLKAEESKLTPDEAIARHDTLVANIQKLSSTVAARSGMNIDPSPETDSAAPRSVPGTVRHGRGRSRTRLR
jgi:hypothetical protein